MVQESRGKPVEYALVDQWQQQVGYCKNLLNVLKSGIKNMVILLKP